MQTRARVQAKRSTRLSLRFFPLFFLEASRDECEDEGIMLAKYRDRKSAT